MKNGDRLWRQAGWRFVFSVLLIGCGAKGPPGEGQKTSLPSRMTTKTGIEMVLIPAGEFVMGDHSGQEDETPAHQVKIDAFHMDVYEVTQDRYEMLMGTNPARFKSPKQPVEQVSWYGAIKYCNMRSLKEGLAPCYDLETLVCDYAADGYRLPTEAEWEYACRAGTATPYSYGREASKLPDYGWFDGNSRKSTHPVGQKRPNPWGLYDMHGNVWEWCNDWYSSTFYKEGIIVNPRNDIPGEERVLRGGGWESSSEDCRSAARYSEAPGFADVCFGYDAYGFRCVRRVPNEAGKTQRGALAPESADL